MGEQLGRRSILYETVKRQDVVRSRTRECPDYLNSADVRIEVSDDKGIVSILTDEGFSIDGYMAGDEARQSCGGGRCVYNVVAQVTPANDMIAVLRTSDRGEP